MFLSEMDSEFPSIQKEKSRLKKDWGVFTGTAGIIFVIFAQVWLFGWDCLPFHRDSWYNYV